ncbi:MAG: FHA domain-containing protein [Cocleimonas sp.]
MAEVILETIQRGVHSYHKINSFPVTLGRAFDNDIILQDVTISAHHLVIEQEGDKYLIKNLSEENGTKLEGETLGTEAVEIKVPASFQLSNLKARLLATDMPVEETYVQSCSGFFCFFSSPIWAMLLLFATVAVFFIERYLETPVAKEPLYYLSNVLPSVWTLLGITVIISGITRISTHRWEIIPAISIASLVFLVPQLFEYIGHFVSYLFTSDSLGSWLKNIASFMIIPLLLAVFIVKTIHAKWLPAFGIAALVYSPFLAYQVIGLVDDLNLKSGFSEIPAYSQTLLPNDMRLNKTISLDQFINEADKQTTTVIQQLLVEAKEKEAKS